jgi:hypothetical protein
MRRPAYRQRPRHTPFKIELELVIGVAGKDKVFEGAKIHGGVCVAGIYDDFAIRRLHCLLQHEEKLLDAAFPGTVGPEQNRERSHFDRLGIPPALEVL